MIRLPGWGDEAVPPRAAGGGFVPHLESLEARLVLSGKIKMDFAVANPDVPAHVSTLPPPAVGLAPAPGGAGEAAGLVQLPGGESGFDRGGGDWIDPAKTDKDKFEPYYAGGSASGSAHVLGVWVGVGNESPVPAAKATPILF